MSIEYVKLRSAPSVVYDTAVFANFWTHLRWCCVCINIDGTVSSNWLQLASGSIYYAKLRPAPSVVYDTAIGLDCICKVLNTPSVVLYNADRTGSLDICVNQNNCTDNCTSDVYMIEVYRTFSELSSCCGKDTCLYKLRTAIVYPSYYCMNWLLFGLLF